MKLIADLISRKVSILFVGLVLILTSMVGCGPVSGLAHLIRARIDLDLAKSAGAQETATYEYESARQYLQKAKEEYGYSDFLAADEYAVNAEKFARKARTKAEAASGTL